MRDGEFYHEVADDESIVGIGNRYGFHWETLWQHERNADLRRERGVPTILRRGDRVWIPQRERREEGVGTETRTSFVKKGSGKLVLELRSAGQPRAQVDCRFEVSGRSPVEDRTDGRGRIELPVPPGARSGILTVFGDLREVYLVRIGDLDPVRDVRGAQQRLANLGFLPSVTGAMDTLTRAALSEFQHRQEGLEPSGELDDATARRLAEVHGS